MARIKGGFILQPRLFDGSDASKMPPCTREVWLYILRNVNYKDGDKLKRGQGFFVISEIMEALSWHIGFRKMTYSKTQVAKALRRLREGSMTATTKTTRGLIISVCNYNLYQDVSSYEGHTEETMKELRRDRRGDTIQKKVKEVKEVIQKKHTPPANGIFTPLGYLILHGVDKNTAQDFLSTRRIKKLAPTETAFRGLGREIEKTGKLWQEIITLCCENGWGGFKSSWLENKKSPMKDAAQSFKLSRQRGHNEKRT